MKLHASDILKCIRFVLLQQDVFKEVCSSEVLHRPPSYTSEIY